jgi:hypothetical protein
MDKFKQVAAKVIAAVAQEPGTLMYEWTLRPDGKTFDVTELYKTLMPWSRTSSTSSETSERSLGKSKKEPA